MDVKSKSLSLLSAVVFSATVAVGTTIPTIASADGYNSNRVVIYFTRHAEKKTTTAEIGPAIQAPDTDSETSASVGVNLAEQCGDDKCAEELSDLGLLRAQLLADWFDSRGITNDVTHVFSSHKTRTRQTVEEIAIRAGLNNDNDLISDGVQQLPSDGTELNPQSTSVSEQLTADALLGLDGGSVAVVAGHSGTLYDIMDLLGINTDDSSDFPRKSGGKVRDFGDLWKVVIKNNTAKFRWRKNLQPTRLRSVQTEPGIQWPEVDQAQ